MPQNIESVLGETSNNTYYISPFGSDTNNGTSSAPWKTIDKASKLAKPGDIIFLQPGVYHEKIVPANSGTSNNYITYRSNSDAIIDGTGITLNSVDGRGDGLVQILGKSFIKIQGIILKNSSVNCVNISSNDSGIRPSYIEIVGLNIQNCKKVGVRSRQSQNILIKDNIVNHISYSSGIAVWNSKNIVVDNNRITNAHYYHESQGAYDEAITISSVDQFEVKNNLLDNNEALPYDQYGLVADKLGIDIKESSQNGSVHHNTIKNMNAAGIYTDSWHAGANGTPTLNHINIYSNYLLNAGLTIGAEQSDGITEYINIYNNIIVNAPGRGIEVRRAWGDGLRKNINIYNNIVFGADPKWGNGGAGIAVNTSHLATNNSDKPVIIRNNISSFYFLTTGGGTVGQIRAANSSIANLVTADHNIVFGPTVCSQQYPNCVEIGGRDVVSPIKLYVDPSAYNLHPIVTSFAIDNGISTNLLVDDFDSVKRPQGTNFDIGAYEFISTVIPTYTPTPTNNSSTIIIYAAGTVSKKQYPTLQLKINGSIVKEWPNVSGDPAKRIFNSYVYTSLSKISPNQITINYSNDGKSSSEDRNLMVDKIIVNGVTYQTEAAATYSVGTWGSGNCNGGYKKSEWLHCNGYFKYEN